MNALLRVFYVVMLWAVRFELSLAVGAPVRNHRLIDALQRDESEYERALIRLDLAL